MGERRGKAEVNGKNMMLLGQDHPRHIPDQIKTQLLVFTCQFRALTKVGVILHCMSK